MSKIIIKAGSELNKDQIRQINQAEAREFRITLSGKERLAGKLFFLLVDDKKILAMGALILVEPVRFTGETFSILGIGGVLANEKGKGYGKQMMLAIKDYLIAKDKTGIGFCRRHNQGFYEKCGFKVDPTTIKRFVFQKGEEKITNSGDDCVLYLDTSDHFMQKVLSCPDREVFLSRPPNW